MTNQLPYKKWWREIEIFKFLKVEEIKQEVNPLIIGIL